jgi:hypothetical protein
LTSFTKTGIRRKTRHILLSVELVLSPFHLLPPDLRYNCFALS